MCVTPLDDIDDVCNICRHAWLYGTLPAVLSCQSVEHLSHTVNTVQALTLPVIMNSFAFTNTVFTSCGEEGGVSYLQ